MSWIKTWQQRDREKFEWISSYICAETWNEYDEEWYDYFWYNKKWRTRDGYDREWYNKAWFNKKWIHKVTKKYYDPDWYDMYWYNEDWYDREWYDENWYNEEWYDREWYDEDWFNKKRIHKITKTYYDPDWFNKEWLNSRWFDRKKINKFTKWKFDLEWFDFDWYNENWFNKEWSNKDWESILILKSDTEKELEKINKEINYHKKLLNTSEKDLQKMHQEEKKIILSEINKCQEIIDSYKSKINELNNKKISISERIKQEKKANFNPLKIKKLRIQWINATKDDEIKEIDNDIASYQKKIEEEKELITLFNHELNMSLENVIKIWIPGFVFITEGHPEWRPELLEKFKESSIVYNESQKELDRLTKKQSEIQNNLDYYNAIFKSLSKYL